MTAEDSNAERGDPTASGDDSGETAGDRPEYDDWAHLYDAFTPDSMRGDREFYARLAADAEGPTLEIGCGTGRIYLESRRRGADAYGIDRSAGMLAVLRDRAREVGVVPGVWRADMTDFAVDRQFALVTIPFRTLLMATTVEERVATLRNVRAALAPGGRLVFNAFVPSHAYVAEHYGETRTRTAVVDGRRYRQEKRVEFEDEVERVVRTERRFYDDETDELVAEGVERLASVTKPEAELLLDRAGFDEREVYGGFGGAPLVGPHQEMVWFARAE